MPRIAFWQPSLHGFGTPQDDFRFGSRMKDDIVQRGSGRSETSHAFLTSFSGGASGSAAQVAPDSGREVGVSRLLYTLTGTGNQSAGVLYGYTGGNAAWRLDPNYDYTFTAKVRASTILQGSGTLNHDFLGMAVLTAVTNNFTNAIGFIRDPLTFAGDRWRFEPICRDGFGSTRLSNAESICLFTTDPTPKPYRSFMWRATHDGVGWTVTFYKLWDDKNTVGGPGEWINLGSITTNIPTNVNLGFVHHSIVTTSSFGMAGNNDWNLDFVTFEQRNKNVWRFAQ